MSATLEVTMAKKKGSDKEPAKRYGTLIRVSDDFAELLRKVCPIEGLSAADVVDSHLKPVLEERYRVHLANETKKLGRKRNES